MKKILIFTLLTLIISVYTFADTYTHSAVYGQFQETYYLDRRIAEGRNKTQEHWFINNSQSNFMCGGFVTFVLPVSKHFGFNLDFAVTNKTGFNVCLDINATIPIK